MLLFFDHRSYLPEATAHLRAQRLHLRQRRHSPRARAHVHLDAPVPAEATVGRGAGGDAGVGGGGGGGAGRGCAALGERQDVVVEQPLQTLDGAEGLRKDGRSSRSLGM